MSLTKEQSHNRAANLMWCCNARIKPTDYETIAKALGLESREELTTLFNKANRQRIPAKAGINLPRVFGLDPAFAAGQIYSLNESQFKFYYPRLPESMTNAPFDSDKIEMQFPGVRSAIETIRRYSCAQSAAIALESIIKINAPATAKRFVEGC